MNNLPTPPPLEGIHHLKLAVSDLQRSLRFYEALLGANRIPQADHHRENDKQLYAYILNVPNLGAKLELRLNPAQAQKHRHFDPITLAVKDRHALDQWQKHLRRENIPHSPIIVAIQAWLIVVKILTAIEFGSTRWRRTGQS